MYSLNDINVEFNRKKESKDKQKRKKRNLGFFGDKRDTDGKKTLTLREPVLKRGLIGTGIGTGLGALGSGAMALVAKKQGYEMTPEHINLLKKIVGASAIGGMQLGAASGGLTYNQRKNTLKDIENYKLK